MHNYYANGLGFRMVTNYELVECCGGSDSKLLVVALPWKCPW